MERRDLDIIYGSSVNWQMYRNKSVMITGATGRLGRYIMETLVDADLRYNLNMCIIGLARSEEKAAQVFENLLDLPNVTFLYQNVNASVEYDGSIDFIFHTADTGGYGVSWSDDLDLDSETIWEDGVFIRIESVDPSLALASSLARAREYAMLTQKQLSEKTGIYQSDISKLERGNANPSILTLKRLADAMDMTLKIEFVPKK